MFESYSYGWQQFVDFDGTVSNTAMINPGVPQGSILGPLPFTYMNGIHMANNKLSAILYADDTNLISPMCAFNLSFSIESSDIEHMSQQINSELDNIQEWLNVNELSLNISKTKFIIFHCHQSYKEHIVPK